MLSRLGSCGVGQLRLLRLNLLLLVESSRHAGACLPDIDLTPACPVSSLILSLRLSFSLRSAPLLLFVASSVGPTA